MSNRVFPVAGSGWQLDPAGRELVRGGERVRLAEKPFLVLAALLETPGAVVTRESLRRRLWPHDVFVDFDNNLNSAVAALRQALGDSARSPRCIATLPKVGYRLVIPPSGAGPAEPGDGRPPAPASGAARVRNRPAVGLAAAAAVAAMAASLSGGRVVTPSPPIPLAKAARSGRPDAQALYERGVYLKGRYLAQPDSTAILEQARAAFRSAASHDPAFVLPVAEEADTLAEMSFAGAMPFRAGLQEARHVAQHALERDGECATALRVLGTADLFLDWDFRGATDRLAAAHDLAPDDARTALARATLFSALGQHERAVAEARRAVTLEPAAYFVRADLAFFYLAAGRYEEASTNAREVLLVAPEFIPALSYSILAHERVGRKEEAADAAAALMRVTGVEPAEVARLEARAPADVLGRWRRWELATARRRSRGHGDEYALQLALKHALAGERAQALDQLERSYARRDALLVLLRAFPELVELRGDLRFERLARRIERAAG